jgi:hypothetical protein
MDTILVHKYFRMACVLVSTQYLGLLVFKSKHSTESITTRDNNNKGNISFTVRLYKDNIVGTFEWNLLVTNHNTPLSTTVRLA